MFKMLTFKVISNILASILSFLPLSSVSFSQTHTPLPTIDTQHVAIDEFHNLERQLATLKVKTEFVPTLKRGSQGDSVKKLQRELNILVPSFPVDYITGHFGPTTEKTIKQLQTNNHVPATGIFDPQTLELISGLVASNSFSPDASSSFSDLEDFLTNAIDISASASSDVSKQSESVSPTSTNLEPTNDQSSKCTNLGYILPEECPSVPDCPTIVTVTPVPTTSINSSPTPSNTIKASPTPTPTKTPTPTPTPTKK